MPPSRSHPACETLFQYFLIVLYLVFSQSLKADHKSTEMLGAKQFSLRPASSLEAHKFPLGEDSDAISISCSLPRG
jgi:hypothetical protein